MMFPWRLLLCQQDNLLIFPWYICHQSGPCHCSWSKTAFLRASNTDKTHSTHHLRGYEYTREQKSGEQREGQNRNCALLRCTWKSMTEFCGERHEAHGTGQRQHITMQLRAGRWVDFLIQLDLIRTLVLRTDISVKNCTKMWQYPKRQEIKLPTSLRKIRTKECFFHVAASSRFDSESSHCSLNERQLPFLFYWEFRLANGKVIIIHVVSLYLHLTNPSLAFAIR